MRYLLPSVLATSVVLLTSCAKPPSTPAQASASISPEARIQQIPAADPQKYAALKDMKAWRNPYLIIRADGVALLDPDDHLERILKPGELTQALGNLPSSAWPYGRVVAVTENGVRGSADDDVKIRTNRAIVAGTLESMHVLINWVPSA